jgi:hypothetical protein
MNNKNFILLPALVNSVDSRCAAPSRSLRRFAPTLKLWRKRL